MSKNPTTEPAVPAAVLEQRHEVAAYGADGWLRWFSQPTEPLGRAWGLLALARHYDEIAATYPGMDWPEDVPRAELDRAAEGWRRVARVLRLVSESERAKAFGRERTPLGDEFEKREFVGCLLDEFVGSDSYADRAVLLGLLSHELAGELYGNAPDELDSLAHAYRRAHRRTTRRGWLGRGK